jgi:hypothetical protein
MPSMTPILATLGRLSEHDIQTGNSSGILAISQIDMPSITSRLAKSLVEMPSITSD